ncbi:TPA: Mu-like prophage major head subunit gpT family protein [Citrobacter freundii]|uniref:Mu-like prophage major head subunit gpT family protein n=1 Tax=Citrobacter freundii TaxID=546 RepID=UPI0015EA4C62|nr:Mu-like prophage major head subunit gpT family protein [Citrobacter freundii]MCC2938164.1 Mu-like prophage major head subunit gpT family protein [Citrobacter freundii]MDE9644274.1 Mu-like prophage major head subunit gpT family protein [Citrobacter freundii]MDE9692724.1 Mu-like prophage major head subunit gpT family protein [Citrobacter freundii]MDE9698373.1 Mu-like prophage major head subunit gpT family protein [Citrobacter freundii]QLZ31540.1 Mu-like prophage major head subunit gpT family 
MAVTIDASILNALSTSLSAAFTRGVGRITPQFRSVATVVPSSGASNTYGWLDDFPGIKEWVSTRQLLTLKEMGYSITNKTWESSIKVKREKIEDDQLGQYSVIAEQFGRSVTMFPDSLVFKLLCDGFTTTCFDGQYFFDSDHPVGTGTASNVVGTPATDTGESWFLVDATQALLPIIFQNRRPFDFKALDDLDNEHTFTNNEFLFGTDGRCNVGYGFWQTAVGSKAALTTENYEAAVSAMLSLTKSNGEPLGVSPTLLVVGKGNRAAAKKLIEAVNNDAGASNIYYKDVDVLVSPYVK